MGSYTRILSLVFLGSSSVLDRRGRLGGLGEKAGMLVVNLRTTRVVYWVNVCESFVAGSPGLSWIEGR